MILRMIECLFKGHVIDPSESIVGDIMIDKRNWLCKCHRCGRYLMHDGAMSGGTVTMSEREALQTKKEFEEQMELFRLGREIARNVTAD